ncbi:fatty acyl-AMP ligase [Streptomyces sp. NPDC056704]|uniref:fatty acyl-AMP ligase n=1 Tax=Streptomyces sp. NPDC056704 TaxID=3345917 RepID=UPI003678016C
MSRFVDALLATATQSSRGMVTGEPKELRWRSWAEIHRQARQVAVALIAEGVAPGTAVAVLATEPVLIAPTVQGVWLAGGSVTMLHQPTPRTDLAEWSRDTVRVLEMIGSPLVLLSPSFTRVAAVLAEQGIAHRLLTDLVEPEGSGVNGTALSGRAPAPMPPQTRKAAPVPGGAALPFPVGEDATALLQLTSGSTGAPRAVRITHGNLISNITAMAERMGCRPEEDVLASWLPLFHDMGMIGFLALPMALGAELVKITPLDFLSAPLLWPALISTYGVSVTSAPNFAYALVARFMAKVDNPGTFDLSTLRVAVNGAEPIDAGAVRAFTSAGARFGMPRTCVVPAYGLAEATLTVSAAPLATDLAVDVVDTGRLTTDGLAVPAEPGAVSSIFCRLGTPLPGLEVSVVTADGAPLGDREVGHLRVRGTSVTPGYLTESGPVSAQDELGWVNTGDLGYLADGDVVVCGRVKDVIIMGGRNIYPTDIERAAASVDGVRVGHAAAIRMNAGTLRERFAVAVESPRINDAQAVALLRKEITARVVDLVGVRPAAVHVLKPGTLPKTTSGKLRRAAAAEQITAL